MLMPAEVDRVLACALSALLAAPVVIVRTFFGWRQCHGQIA